MQDRHLSRLLVSIQEYRVRLAESKAIEMCKAVEHTGNNKYV